MKAEEYSINSKMDESCLWINGSKISLKVHRLPKLPLRKFYNPQYFLKNSEAGHSAKHQIANHYRDFKLHPNLKLQCNYLTRHLRNIRNKGATVRSKCLRSRKEQRQQLPTTVCYLSSHVSQSGDTLIPYNDTVRRILNANDNYELLKQLTERYLSRVRGKLYRSSLASNVKQCYDKGKINCCHKYRNCYQAISKNLDSEPWCGPAIWNCYGSINTVESVNDLSHDSNVFENSKCCENVDKRNQLEQQQSEQQNNYRPNAQRLEETNAVEEFRQQADSFHDAEDDYQTHSPFHIETQIKNQNDIITKSSKSVTATPTRTTICEPAISINITRDRIGRSTRANNTEGNKRHHIPIKIHHTNNEQQDQQQQRIRNKINSMPLKSSLGKLIRDQQIKDQNSSSVVPNIAGEPSAVQLIRVEIKQIVLNEKRKQ